MLYFQEINNLSLYKSSIFDEEQLTHAFTTRSCGNVQDKKTRQMACETLGIKYKNLIVPEQKHTDNIKIVSSPDEDLSNCDGLITQTPGLGLILLFADCVPVILYAPDKHVVAVIHAGWRGTAKSIVTKALGLMEKEFKADPQNIQTAIGPAIGQCCYPVSDDVAQQLLLTVEKKDNQHINNNIDLKKINAMQLIERGVVNIEVSDECTSCKKSIFYSYRAEDGNTDRHAAIACLKPSYLHPFSS